MGEYMMSLNEQTLQPQQNKTKQTYAHFYGMFYTHHVLWLAQFVAVRFRPFRFVSVMTRKPVEINPLPLHKPSVRAKFLYIAEYIVALGNENYMEPLKMSNIFISLLFSYHPNLLWREGSFLRDDFCRNWQRHVCIAFLVLYYFFFQRNLIYNVLCTVLMPLECYKPVTNLSPLGQ